MVPASWAQFTIHAITSDQTKYASTIAALDQDTAVRLLNLLRYPPMENKYETMKTRLTKTFGLIRRALANKLLQMGNLGERMPSGLMDEMLALLDGHQPCMLFEQLFLNLPDAIHLQLADADFADPRKIAEQADELWLSMSLSSYSTVHKVAWPRS